MGFSLLSSADVEGILGPSSDIHAVLSSVDQNAIFEEEKAKWSVEIWDRKSPINGTPAEVMLERSDVAGHNGEIYLLKQGDQVVFFQPHDPDVSGIVPIKKGRGKARGLAHIEAIAELHARGRIVEQVRERLQKDSSGS